MWLLQIWSGSWLLHPVFFPSVLRYTDDQCLCEDPSWCNNPDLYQSTEKPWFVDTWRSAKTPSLHTAKPTTHYCQYHRVIYVITQKLLLPTRLNDPSENQIKWNPSVSPCSNIIDQGVREFHEVVQNSDSSCCNNQFLNPNIGVHKSWWSFVMCHWYHGSLNQSSHKSKWIHFVCKVGCWIYFEEIDLSLA